MITKEMIKMMRCPNSPADKLAVEIDKQEGDKIIEGKLIAESTATSYPIVGGVPDLIPYEILNDADWKMWKDHLDGFQERREQRIKNPDSAIVKLSKPARPNHFFAKFTGIAEGAILDIGCGPGKFRHNFNSEKVQYIGLDPIVLPDVEDFPFVRGLAEYIPFDNDTFTDVVVLAAMDHFKDLDRFFHEVIRVLTPNGKLHILQSIHEVKGPVSAVKMLSHYLKDKVEDRSTKIKNPDAPKHLSEFSQTKLFTTVKKYFDIVAVEDYSARWYSPKKLFLSLSAAK